MYCTLICNKYINQEEKEKELLW